MPLECTAEFGAHAPVCSFVVRPVLDVDLLEAVNRDVIGDAAPAHDDTAETLRQRLVHSTAFDNPRIVVSKRTRHGNFKFQRELADGAPHPAPRCPATGGAGDLSRARP